MLKITQAQMFPHPSSHSFNAESPHSNYSYSSDSVTEKSHRKTEKDIEILYRQDFTSGKDVTDLKKLNITGESNVTGRKNYFDISTQGSGTGSLKYEDRKLGHRDFGISTKKLSLVKRSTAQPDLKPKSRKLKLHESLNINKQFQKNVKKIEHTFDFKKDDHDSSINVNFQPRTVLELEVYMPFVDVERDILIPPKYKFPILRKRLLGSKYGNIINSRIPKLSKSTNAKHALHKQYRAETDKKNTTAATNMVKKDIERYYVKQNRHHWINKKCKPYKVLEHGQQNIESISKHKSDDLHPQDAISFIDTAKENTEYCEEVEEVRKTLSSHKLKGSDLMIYDKSDTFDAKEFDKILSESKSYKAVCEKRLDVKKSKQNVSKYGAFDCAMVTENLDDQNKIRSVEVKNVISGFANGNSMYSGSFLPQDKNFGRNVSMRVSKNSTRRKAKERMKCSRKQSSESKVLPRMQKGSEWCSYIKSKREKSKSYSQIYADEKAYKEKSPHWEEKHEFNRNCWRREATIDNNKNQNLDGEESNIQSASNQPLKSCDSKENISADTWIDRYKCAQARQRSPNFDKIRTQRKDGTWKNSIKITYLPKPRHV